MPRPLFSICIPTYNRAQTLKTTLERITSDPDFDSRVEIVISDNCSPDNTPEVAREFAARFPNIVYNRNDENIRQRNFFEVLSLGSGEYVKLQNDYLFFAPGALGNILDEIQKHIDTREQLFFCYNTGSYKDTHALFPTASQYLAAVTYWITWISAFGTWREQLAEIDQPYQFTDLRFDQIDWAIQVAAMRPTIVFFGNFYSSNVSNIKKSGYNLVEVFVENFLTILRYHRDKGHIDDAAVEVAKKSVYEHMILPFLYYIKIQKSCNLDTTGAMGILWRNYRSHLYFYTAPFKMGWKFIAGRLKR